MSSANDSEARDDSNDFVRMSALATLPVFFKLAGKRALIAGGQDAALWKAELLSAAGAHVEIYAADMSPGMEALAASLGSPRITLVRRAWTAPDLKGAAIAVGAIATDSEAEAFLDAARASGVPVNVVDRPEFCDFQFGAIVNRSPLVVGISTDGAAPVFGQAIRSAIEGLLPAGFKHWAEAAKAWRRLGDRLGADMSARRRFWERFAELAFTNADRMPVEADVGWLLVGDAPTRLSDTNKRVMIICLQDASADNLTLGAVRALRTADHLCCGSGVPAAVSDFARREASRSGMSDKTAKAACDENVRELVTFATAGKRVVHVRLGSDADDLTADLTSAGLVVTVIHCGRVNDTSAL